MDIGAQTQAVPQAGKAIPVFRVAINVLIFGAFLAVQSVRAEQNLLVLSSPGSPYLEVKDKLLKSLRGNIGIALDAMTLSELKSNSQRQASFGQADLVVTIGTTVTRFVAENYPDKTVLAIFVTSYSFRSVIETLGDDHRFFALYIDQPIQRSLHLARLLLPDAKSLASFGLDPQSPFYDIARAEAQLHNFDLQVVQLSPSKNPIRTLDRFFANCDVLLVYPHSGSFDRKSAKWMLYLASRHRKAVIGFSEKYVNAGALASVYTSPANIATEAAAVLRSWLEQGVPKSVWARSGREFSVKINPSVARFLNLAVMSEEKLSSLLRNEDHHSNTFWLVR